MTYPQVGVGLPIVGPEASPDAISTVATTVEHQLDAFRGLAGRLW